MDVLEVVTDATASEFDTAECETATTLSNTLNTEIEAPHTLVDLHYTSLLAYSSAYSNQFQPGQCFYIFVCFSLLMCLQVRVCLVKVNVTLDVSL